MKKDSSKKFTMDIFKLSKEIFLCPITPDYDSFDPYFLEFYSFLKTIVMSYFEVLFLQKEEKLWEILFEFLLKGITIYTSEVHEMSLEIMLAFFKV